MKIKTCPFLILFLLFANMPLTAQTFYDLKAKTIEGQEFSFTGLKGKKVLIVNTASKCGYTSQYEDLEKLYQQYKEAGFIILGFPANNFMQQEPGTNAGIKEFCTKNYGVTFPMMEKISVKGDDMHAVYQWLTKKALNGKMDSEVQWNFQKYMIDEKGNLADLAAPKTKPMSDKIVNWITAK